MLHLRGDIEPRHNIPGRPMLDLASGLLFLGGLIATAKADWPLPAKTGLLSLWLLPLMPSAVTLAAPNALRAVGLSRRYASSPESVSTPRRVSSSASAAAPAASRRRR